MIEINGQFKNLKNEIMHTVDKNSSEKLNLKDQILNIENKINGQLK